MWTTCIDQTRDICIAITLLPLLTSKYFSWKDKCVLTSTMQKKKPTSNYRPISLTCVLCKVMEHIVTQMVLGHCLLTRALQLEIIGLLKHEVWFIAREAHCLLSSPLPNCERFPWSICNGVEWQQGTITHPETWFLPFLTLEYVPIV